MRSQCGPRRKVMGQPLLLQPSPFVRRPSSICIRNHTYARLVKPLHAPGSRPSVQAEPSLDKRK